MPLWMLRSVMVITVFQLPPCDVLVLHLMFYHSTVVQVSFGRVIKAVTLKIHILCFVLINSILFKLLCVWIFPPTNTNIASVVLKLNHKLYHDSLGLFLSFVFFLTDKRRFLMEMRGYMPPAHRRFITAVENQTKSLRSLGTSSFFFAVQIEF